MPHNGVGKALVHVRVFWKRHDQHARSGVWCAQILSCLFELFTICFLPTHNLRMIASAVAVKAHVEDPDEIALVDHDGTLVVLVDHAPYAVLRVVVAGQLCLPPERRPELLGPPATAKGQRQHVVLDVRTQQEEVRGKTMDLHSGVQHWLSELPRFESSQNTNLEALRFKRSGSEPSFSTIGTSKPGRIGGGRS